MYNWSVDEEALQKDPERYARWRLEQTINFGLNGGKISERQLRRHWEYLQIDPARRRTLHLLLHGRISAD